MLCCSVCEVIRECRRCAHVRFYSIIPSSWVEFRFACLKCVFQFHCASFQCDCCHRRRQRQQKQQQQQHFDSLTNDTINAAATATIDLMNYAVYGIRIDMGCMDLNWSRSNDHFRLWKMCVRVCSITHAGREKTNAIIIVATVIICIYHLTECMAGGRSLIARFAHSLHCSRSDFLCCWCCNNDSGYDSCANRDGSWAIVWMWSLFYADPPHMKPWTMRAIFELCLAVIRWRRWWWNKINTNFNHINSHNLRVEFHKAYTI